MSRRNNLMVRKSTYQISMMTLIASLIWIVISIYQKLQDPIENAIDPEMLKPLSPVINGETLDNLMIRRQMGENDWVVLDKKNLKVSPEEASSSPVTQ